MTTSNTTGLRDVALLTRAVESVFRKLIRMLIGRMSLKKLQEMVQIIFVEEAEAKLKQDHPGKTVSLTKLGSITDLDTRTLTKIRSTHDSRLPMYLDSSFLKGFTPGFKVLDVWINDQRYANKSGGKPVALDFSGPGLSFEGLVEQAVSTRGVTAKSMLDRLRENKFVEISADTGKIQLIRNHYIFQSNDELDMVDIGFSAIADLATTVAHNIRNADDPDSRFYQAGCWTYHLSESNRAAFQKAMFDFLHEVDKKTKEAMMPFEESTSEQGQLTAGISMFYFEEGPLSQST
jgi:hypothetical protein